MAIKVSKGVLRRGVLRGEGIRAAPDITSALPIRQMMVALRRAKPIRLKRYKRVMFLREVPKKFLPMHMEIANKALRHNIVYGMIGIQQQFTQTAPVKTGTLVANYAVSEGRSSFKQYAGFYPRVVRGTGNEVVARRRAIDRSIIRIPRLVKARGFVKLTNPTPYCRRIPFYRSGLSNRIRDRSRNQLNRLLKKEIPFTASRLDKYGRMTS